MPIRSLPDKVLREAVRLRERGWTLQRIGDKFGITKQAVRYRLQRAKHQDAPERRVCELFECDTEYEVVHRRQRCCCRKHTKRLNVREQMGVTARMGECALPECRIEVLLGVKGRKYCEHYHGVLNYARIKSGAYAALLGLREPCFVCGEAIVVDDHHTEWDSTGSNKEGPTRPLCPTHHMAIHRGFARLTEAGEYEWLADQLREDLLRKQPELVAKIRERI